jgi:hypothetical protein
MLPSGKFTSSVFSKLICDDDIIRKDLTEDIKEIFSKTEKFFGKVKYQESNKALFVYIADDHAGIDFKESLFGNPYTGDIYHNRLKELAKQIISLDYVIDTLFIVNLGDELDGFNKQTTRGGHALESLSNKEQFNIYTSARKIFYDTILTSNLFKEMSSIPESFILAKASFSQSPKKFLKGSDRTNLYCSAFRLLGFPFGARRIGR